MLDGSMRSIGVIAVLFLAGWRLHAMEPAPVSLEEAAECLGLSTRQLAELRSGRIVAAGLDERTDKELAVTTAMLVDRPLAEVAAAARTGWLMEADPQTLRFAPLDDESDLDALEAGEVRALLQVRAGTEFNLSADEIARFQALRRRFPGSCDVACAESVVEEYRRALLARLAAYRAGGTAAIAGYARANGEVANAGEELRTAARACELLHRHFPEVIEAFVDYPRRPAESALDRYYWATQRVSGRPDVTLVHRMIVERPHVLLVFERQFYVGHAYNGLVVLSGAFDVDGRTLVFAISRSSTDQAAGFPRDVRHALGRRHMRAQFTASFERIRATSEAAAR
jgi:hypothetical protein